MLGPSFLIGKYSGLNSLLILLMFFSIGALVGAGAAVDDTPKSHVQKNMSQVEDDVVDDVRENATGPMKPVTIGIARMAGANAEMVGKHGVNFGYAHPHAAEVLGYLTPFAMITAIALQIINLYRS